MNTAITNASGTGLMSREDLAKSLNNAAMSMPTVGGGNDFLKMDKKNGDWVFGQEETLVEDDSLWAVNPMSIKQGWVAWDTEAGGAPLQEVMVPINRPLPPVGSLPALPMSTPDKRGITYQLTYQEQRSVEFVCVSGEDKGTTVEYKQSSTGAMKLFGKLINALLDQVQKGDDIVAVGHLSHESYDHKKYGKTFNPLFNVVEWRKIDDTAVPVEDDKTEASNKTGTEQMLKAEAAAQASLRSSRMPRGTVINADPVVQSGGAVASATAPDDEEEAALAREYEAASAAVAENPAPRRRVRR